MAGGIGERLWPKSRKALPKQFLSFGEENKSLIRLTVDRVLPLVSERDVYVIGNAAHKELMSECLPMIPKENIIFEPFGRNTAACIGLGAMVIARKYGDAVMTVLPSDHFVKCDGQFREVLKQAADLAENTDDIITVGITPNYPETGYGYIKSVCENETDSVYKAEKFVEKPDESRAKQYLKEGGYFWNAGIFVFKASVLLNKIREHLPDTYKKLCGIGDALGTATENEVLIREYADIEPVSIDKGVMEHTDGIRVVRGDFGWDDLGSWLAVGRMLGEDGDKNTVIGNAVTLDTENTTVIGDKRMIAALGVKNTIIVDTDDVVFVCDKEHLENIKQLHSALEDCGLEKYL